LKRDLLVLCDKEEEYAHLMSDFLNGQDDLPWEIHTYTRVVDLKREEGEKEIALLVIAESTYEEHLQMLHPKCTILLNESGVMKWDGVHYVDKYQQAEWVYKSLLGYYADVVEPQFPQLLRRGSAKLIGMYSPVKRCLQTSFALSMSQLLAEKYRVLYLNFEHYAGISELLPDMQTRDLSDLMYFLNADENTFRLRFQTILRCRGGLDYVPPVKAGQNLLTIPAGEWMELLHKLSALGEYEFIILDLCDSMQGVFDILRSCVRVYTLTEEGNAARSKLLQYEQVLALYHYDDVLGKTQKCCVPSLHSLPGDLEQYTRGELAAYVRKQIEDI